MTLVNLISNPDKVFWPDEGYTKLDLARFYQAVFPKLRPYVSGRMLTMERCPDGMVGECFYQKEAPDSLPGATPTKLTHSLSLSLSLSFRPTSTSAIIKSAWPAPIRGRISSKAANLSGKPPNI